MELKISDDELLAKYNAYADAGDRLGMSLTLGKYQNGILQSLLTQMEKIMAELDALKVAVEKSDKAIDETIVLVKSLRDAITAAGTDAEALAKVTADIDAHATALEALKSPTA